MEPRPQSPRSSSGAQPAPAGRAPEDTGAYQQQPGPSTVVAPQRSDYDYSPLDLAPPGQRRRRQMVAAGIGGLVLLLLIAAAVFATIALTGGGDDDDGEGTDLAALQTQIATMEAAEVGTPDVAGETDPDGVVVADPEGEEAAGEGNEPTATENEAGNTDGDGNQEVVVAEDPNSEEQVAGAPSEADLEALLPSDAVVPQGLDAVEDSSRTQEEVVGALGGSREAETNLDQWGWSGNVERRFTASDPASLTPEATTDLTVSLHGFANEQAAAEALVFYSDILLGLGYEEVEVGDIGATNRMLRQPLEDGGTNVALYVQEGPTLYRIGGYSPGGDPTTNVVNVAQAMVSE